jgi:AcrR family transcriptional regulator
VTAPPSRLPRGEGAKLADAILDAADELLTASGSVGAVSMAKIADAVHRTQPSIYAHFPDKATLIRAVCERTFQRLGEYLDTELVDVHDPWERLDRRARAYVRFAVDHPEHYRLLFAPSSTDASSHDDLQRLRGYAGLAGLRADIETAMANGSMVPGDPDLLTLAMWSSVHGVASLLVTHPNAAWPDTLLDQVLANHAVGLVRVEPPAT